MALQCPKWFPAQYWLPVIAAEATARSALLTKLEPSGSAMVEGAVAEYLIAVVGTFAEQACAAVRADRVPLIILDTAVEWFVEHVLIHAYWGLANSKIQGHWWDLNYRRFYATMRPRLMSAPWHAWYLSEVPKLLEPVSPPQVSPAVTEQVSDADIKAKARQAVVGPLLESKGWTPARWAERAGVDPSVAYDYLKGVSNPRPDTRAAMAQALGLKIPDLPR